MWNHLVGAKDAFLKIWMAQFETPELKKRAEIFVRRASVSLPPSLYRALKFTFLTDIGSIVSDGQIMSDIGTASLGQSIKVLTPTDFRPVSI